MKKTLKSIISLVLCLCSVLALSACGQQNNKDSNTDDSASIPEESVEGDSNILVAYFSWSGNTQQIANWDFRQNDYSILYP